MGTLPLSILQPVEGSTFRLSMHRKTSRLRYYAEEEYFYEQRNLVSHKRCKIDCSRFNLKSNSLIQD